MPATLTFKSYGPLVTGAPISEVSGTILLGDVSFLNISNPMNPVAVTVTPDKIRTRAVSFAMAAGGDRHRRPRHLREGGRPDLPAGLAAGQGRVSSYGTTA